MTNFFLFRSVVCMYVGLTAFAPLVHAQLRLELEWYGFSSDAYTAAGAGAHAQESGDSESLLAFQTSNTGEEIYAELEQRVERVSQMMEHGGIRPSPEQAPQPSAMDTATPEEEPREAIVRSIPKTKPTESLACAGVWMKGMHQTQVIALPSGKAWESSGGELCLVPAVVGTSDYVVKHAKLGPIFHLMVLGAPESVPFSSKLGNATVYLVIPQSFGPSEAIDVWVDGERVSASRMHMDWQENSLWIALDLDWNQVWQVRVEVVGQNRPWEILADLTGHLPIVAILGKAPPAADKAPPSVWHLWVPPELATALYYDVGQGHFVSLPPGWNHLNIQEFPHIWDLHPSADEKEKIGKYVGWYPGVSEEGQAPLYFLNHTADLLASLHQQFRADHVMAVMIPPGETPSAMLRLGHKGTLTEVVPLARQRLSENQDGIIFECKEGTYWWRGRRIVVVDGYDVMVSE